MTRLLAVGALVALFALSGCGEEQSEPTASDPTSTTSSEASTEATSGSASESTSATADPTEPLCSDVWVDGARLARPYAGCFDGSAWVEADARNCSSGQILVTYSDRYYAAVGGPVNDTGGPLSDSTDYQTARTSCSA